MASTLRDLRRGRRWKGVHGLCLDHQLAYWRIIADLCRHTFRTSAKLTAALAKNGTPGKFGKWTMGISARRRRYRVTRLKDTDSGPSSNSNGATGDEGFPVQSSTGSLPPVPVVAAILWCCAWSDAVRRGQDRPRRRRPDPFSISALGRTRRLL